jgi:hypothetical protein
MEFTEIPLQIYFNKSTGIQVSFHRIVKAYLKLNPLKVKPKQFESPFEDIFLYKIFSKTLYLKWF